MRGSRRRPSSMIQSASVSSTASSTKIAAPSKLPTLEGTPVIGSGSSPKNQTRLGSLPGSAPSTPRPGRVRAPREGGGAPLAPERLFRRGGERRGNLTHDRELRAGVPQREGPDLLTANAALASTHGTRVENLRGMALEEEPLRLGGEARADLSLELAQDRWWHPR